MNIIYEKLKSEHIDQCLNLIYDQFITRETLCKCLNIGRSDCGEHFERLLQEAVMHEKSFVAIDNRCIVGLRCNFERNVPANDSDDTELEVKSDFDRIGRLLAKIKSDALKLVAKSFKRYLDFEFVIVRDTYCRLGIAQRLVEMSIELAKTSNFNGILTIATTYNSAKMFEKLKFVTLLEVTESELLNAFPELKNERQIQSIKCLIKEF